MRANLPNGAGLLFHSPAFLFIFLPIFLALAYLLQTQGKLTIKFKLLIIVSTYIFYGIENPYYLVPFLIATSLDLIWARLILSERFGKFKRAFVTLSVVQNLFLFFIFKYLNWFHHVFPNLWITTEMHSFFGGGDDIFLPPGLSFYLFESISYVVDCSHGLVNRKHKSSDFLLFITMFPRFIAGPIVRYKDINNQITGWQRTYIRDGLIVFLIGLNIKILLADSCGTYVTSLFDLRTDLLGCWFSLGSYFLQLYLDFSAYSLMAIGLGKAIGFEFFDNFREPYLSKSITEFWRRWHISLSTWLRDYVYIPLGGSRSGPKRTHLNLLITMTLGGIWHGASINFMIWGIYHGILLILDKKVFRGAMRSQTVTVLLVMFGWIPFRAHDLNQTKLFFLKLFDVRHIDPFFITQSIARNLLFFPLALFSIYWVFILEKKLRSRLDVESGWATFSIDRLTAKVTRNVFATLMVLTSLTLIFILSEANIPFLYFRF